MKRRLLHKSHWFAIIVTLALVAVSLSGPIGTALAVHGDVTLTGSNFEIDTDANLKVDHAAPSLDWANVTEDRKDDEPTGQNDNSFGQGSKEDDAVPSVVSGSIPPNKSDLKTFGVYQEENAGGKFLNLFWLRVQDPKGTTNMDFEFNQSTNVSANGVTPERTAGDLLIVYELAKGGTVPQLFLFTWLDGSEGIACEAANSFPCWGDRTDLSAAGGAAGSINTSFIPAAESDGLGDLDPRTFGEAQIDLDFIFDPNKCTSFGSAYLKSRSSDSFTAALKDFIAPQPVNITNCGTVIIRKQTDPDGTPGTFDFTTTVQTDPSNGAAFLLADDGVETLNNVLFGTGYTVTESSLPSGFDLSNIDCSDSVNVTPIVDLASATVTFDIDDASDVADCTFTNQARGTIIVEKITNDGSGSFSFTSSTLTPSAFDLTTTAAGEAGKDLRTFNDILPGTYDVAETVPAYWNLVSASCDDGSDPSSIGLGAGETVTCTFRNVRETGAILVTKTRKHAEAGGAGDPHQGVDFTITGGELAAPGVTVTTDANGQVCYDGLVLSSFVGDYTVTETVPDGYVADAPGTVRTVSVTTEATCGDGNEATASFSNTPLTNITVSVDSQVDGGTASTIDCVLQSTATGPNGDGSLTLSNLLPGTYTCTIVVDP
jgi:hypothetical protein